MEYLIMESVTTEFFLYSGNIIILYMFLHGA